MSGFLLSVAFSTLAGGVFRGVQSELRPSDDEPQIKLPGASADHTSVAIPIEYLLFQLGIGGSLELGLTALWISKTGPINTLFRLACLM